MNRFEAIKTAGRIGGFCVRHLFALLATVAVPCVLWTAAYFAMFLWAAFSGGGMGSPATYPIGLLLVIVCATAVTIVMFFPSTALAEWAAQRHSLPILAQIPIAIAVLAIICGIIACVAATLGVDLSARGVGFNFSLLFVVHLVPLGFYWWVAQSGPVLVAAVRRLHSIFRR